MTNEQINAVADASFGNLNDQACRDIVFFMIGYLRSDEEIPKNTKATFFTQIKHSLEANKLWIK